jgi:heme exporter protein C
MSIDTTPKQSWWSRIAHPGQFVAWTTPLLWPLTILTALLFVVGLWFAFFNSPADYQMGDTVRIMYVHVPNAWLSQFVYGLMFVAAFGTLVWRHPLADVAAKAAAPLGAAFTALALYTGSLWGRPTWGTYWVWDARLTSTLILLFLYVGYLALVAAIEDPRRGDRAGALLLLVGVVNIPIIYFSVRWWNTLHQGASVSLTAAPRMAATMLTGMLLMSLAAWMYAIAAALHRLRSIILERERHTRWVRQLVA